MEVHAHSPAGVESWDNLKPIVDVSFLLNFSRIKRPNLRRYSDRARRKDAALLVELRRRWGDEAYNKLKGSELLTTRGEFDTNKFTLSNVYNALVQQGFQVPQDMSSKFTRFRQTGNAPSDLLQTQTDARLFRTKTVAQLSPIEAMNFCMNRAVQMMTQSIGGFRRNIRLLLKYWASRPYMQQPAQTKMERKIRRGMWAALRRVQSWNRGNMLGDTEWNENKDNALQFFWLACQYYKKAVFGTEQMPPSIIPSGNIYIPNPERVRFNKLLYANVGQDVREQNQIGFLFNREAPQGFKNPYADLYVASGQNTARDQDVAKNFKTYEEVFGRVNRNVYVTGYLGYRWDTIGGYNDAMPFYPYTAAMAMVGGRERSFVQPPDDFPNARIDQATMERAAQVAQYMSVYGKPPDDDGGLTYRLNTLPRADALSGALDWVGNETGGNRLRVKGMDAGESLDLAKPPNRWWARSPYFVGIPTLPAETADARTYLLKALPAYGHIVDQVPYGSNKPVRAVFKPALAQNNRFDDSDVVFDSLPALQLPQEENFNDMMATLFQYNDEQQRNAFSGATAVGQVVRFQYGLPMNFQNIIVQAPAEIGDFGDEDGEDDRIDEGGEVGGEGEVAAEEDGRLPSAASGRGTASPRRSARLMELERRKQIGADEAMARKMARDFPQSRTRSGRRYKNDMHRAVTMPYPHVNAHIPTDPELGQFVTDGDGPAVPYIQNLMWDATLNAHADTRLLSVVLDPTHYRAYLHANLDFYQRPSERVLRHFVHKMGW